jgi:hypothetical protein
MRPAAQNASSDISSSTYATGYDCVRPPRRSTLTRHDGGPPAEAGRPASMVSFLRALCVLLMANRSDVDLDHLVCLPLLRS